VEVAQPLAQANSLGDTMKTITAVVALFLFIFGSSLPQQAWAWGGDGHRTVAAIAFKLLPPAKAAELDRLLQRSEVQENFVDAASYPDEVIRARDHTGQFSPWHYV